MSSTTSLNVPELRRRVVIAHANGHHDEAVALLRELERAEPDEPRWPQRLGDVLNVLGRRDDAVAAWTSAIDSFMKRGSVVQAMAMAKMILELDPSRTEVLARVEGSRRPAARPPPQTGSEALESLSLRILRDFRGAAPGPANAPTRVAVTSASDRTPLPPIPSLIPAANVPKDEVRFDDAPAGVAISLTEAEVTRGRSVQPPPLDVGDAEERPSDGRSPLPALFACVDDAVFREITLRSELIDRTDDLGLLLRRDEQADALYAIVDGGVLLIPAEPEAGAPKRLGAGDVFGEACLLTDAKRGVDVYVDRSLKAFRIDRELLFELTQAHPAVGVLLFELVTHSLVGDLMSSNEFFAAFGPDTRRDLSRHVEVRQAAAGTALVEVGKRCDAVYILLAGGLDAERPNRPAESMSPGVVFGLRSLLAGATSELTVRASSDVLVLRLPARHFIEVALHHSAARAHLSKLAGEAVGSIAPPRLA